MIASDMTPVALAAPTIATVNAAAACRLVHVGREAALTVARRLRAAGWLVPLHDTPVGPRGQRIWAVAAAYHPLTWRLVGQVRYRPM